MLPCVRSNLVACRHVHCPEHLKASFLKRKTVQMLLMLAFYQIMKIYAQFSDGKSFFGRVWTRAPGPQRLRLQGVASCFVSNRFLLYKPLKMIPLERMRHQGLFKQISIFLCRLSNTRLSVPSSCCGDENGL